MYIRIRSVVRRERERERGCFGAVVAVLPFQRTIRQVASTLRNTVSSKSTSSSSEVWVAHTQTLRVAVPS